MRGYEFKSPQERKAAVAELRIPMRGYEVERFECSNVHTGVTNPHAGL